MSLLGLFAFLLFPLFIFASPLSNRYAESLAHHFQAGQFSESLQILDEWEAFEPEQRSKITGMRAAVYLSVGDFERGALFMDQFIQGLSAEELSRGSKSKFLADWGIPSDRGFVAHFNPPPSKTSPFSLGKLFPNTFLKIDKPL